MSKKSSAGIVLILAFAVVATIGSPTVGIHEECLSGASDTDGDGKAGILDPQCAEYPFKDGNGQTETPEDERRTDSNGYNFGATEYANEWEFFLLTSGLAPPDICAQYFGFTPPDATIDYSSSNQADADASLSLWRASQPAPC